QTGATLFQRLVEPEVVGVLSAWDQDAEVPVESAIMPGAVIRLKASQAQLTVLRYVPDYSVDKDTKAVVSLGTEPVNPAVQVRAEIHGQIFERWVWSRFDDPPHSKIEFPVRVSFACTELGPQPDGKYQLLTVPGCAPKMLSVRQGHRVLDEVTPETPFGFTHPDYTVTVKQVRCGAHIKTVWLNRTNRLIRPALVATLRSQLIEQEVVLEFNKPYHFKTDSGTLVLVYRRMADRVGLGPSEEMKRMDS
ncbi:MAG: hypothetical protein K9N55_12175, partial [Phycisphaerae bacterium]|nr:hypothetical protein [Phycisphaerae bacterium]